MLTTIASRYDKMFTLEVKVKMMGKSHKDSAQIFIGSEYFRALVIDLKSLYWKYSTGQKRSSCIRQ